MPTVVQPGWVGRRVSVRRVVERRQDGSLHLGDVVGDLVGLDAQTAVIETRAGLVEIPLPLVAAARQAEPSTAEELALEAVMTEGTRPAEVEQLGGWRLRADHGFTFRANSVLPLRSPGMPLADALARAREWYAERGLPLVIALPTEARRLLDAELGELGWELGTYNHVMAARLDQLRLPITGDAEVVLDAEPTADWLDLYRDGEGATPIGRALLTRHDRIVFARIEQDGRTLAVGRGVVDGGWLGVSAVAVVPDARRRRLGTSIVLALRQWGQQQGAARSYLQVDADNQPAITLYRDLGYWLHHDYRYRREPEM